jgi:hypothetical protein
MTDKPFAPAAERNADAILELLSGHLRWQTSDIDDNHSAINAWIGDSSLDNVAAPLSLDVRTDDVDEQGYDGVFSANTAHIMSFETVADMIALVSRALRPGGVFCLYGPFRIDGEFSTDSNEQFHASLQAGDPQMGIRELADVDALADKGGLRRECLYAMPANNLAVIWRKGRDAA